MRKCALVLGFVLVLFGCDDDDQECPEQICPSLQCNGKECPSCPACKQDCSKCGGSGTCDTSAKDAQITKLTGDLASCNGSLDSCNAGLGDKARSVKSGSRITISQWQGTDGSQFPIFTYFDNQKNKPCSLVNYSHLKDYGCSENYFCATTDNYRNIFSYFDKNRLNSTYRNSTYESTIFGWTTSTVRYDGSTLIAMYGNHPNDNYNIEYPTEKFTDSSCSVPFSGAVINDSSCSYSMDSLIYHEQSEQETNNEVRECIDGSSYNYPAQTTVKTKHYYRPKQASFAILYEKSGNNCIKSNRYVNGKYIILEEASDVSYDTYLNEAKTNYDDSTRAFCNALKQEAIDQDWVKLNSVEL